MELRMRLTAKGIGRVFPPLAWCDVCDVDLDLHEWVEVIGGSPVVVACDRDGGQ